MALGTKLAGLQDKHTRWQAGLEWRDGVGGEPGLTKWLQDGAGVWPGVRGRPGVCPCLLRSASLTFSRVSTRFAMFAVILCPGGEVAVDRDVKTIPHL